METKTVMFLAYNIEGTDGTDLGFALEHLHQGDTFVTFYYNIMNDFYDIQVTTCPKA